MSDVRGEAREVRGLAAAGGGFFCCSFLARSGGVYCFCFLFFLARVFRFRLVLDHHLGSGGPSGTCSSGTAGCSAEPLCIFGKLGMTS